MSEYLSYSSEHEPDEPTLDKEAILNRLFEHAEELGIEIAEDDVEYLLGVDDNDFLGNLVTLALEYGVDPDELFDQLGIAVESSEETE